MVVDTDSLSGMLPLGLACTQRVMSLSRCGTFQRYLVHVLPSTSLNVSGSAQLWGGHSTLPVGTVTAHCNCNASLLSLGNSEIDNDLIGAVPCLHDLECSPIIYGNLIQHDQFCSFTCIASVVQMPCSRQSVLSQGLQYA